LINLTKIDFKEILKYDTFKSNDDDDDELFLGDEESIIL
jgi:hypothetical protein